MKAFFVFSGQGAQTVGRGKDLYDNCPEAKAVFDRADEILKFSLTNVIFNGPDSDLTKSDICQPAIYTTSCAALAAFQAKFPEIKPAACAGLSLGEYAALHASGAFSFDTGLSLLEQRGKFMDAACQANPGGMATILGGDLAQIEEVCASLDIDVANYNSPAQIVISGLKEKISIAVAELKARGMRKVIELNVAGAFHSRLMASAGKKLSEVLKTCEIVEPTTPIYQNYTAQVPANVEEIKANLANQVAGSVLWEKCLRAAVATGVDTVIEFGPGNVLTGLAKRTIPELKCVNINSVDTLNAAEF